MQMVFPLIVSVILILDNVKGAGNDISVQTGGDLLLNVTKKVVLKKFHTFYLKFNSKVILVVSNSSGKPTAEKNYTGIIEIFGNEGFFKLKNLQKSDSGVYSTWGLGDKWELLEEYNVTVKGSANYGVVAGLAVVLFPYLVSGAAVGPAAVVIAAVFAVWCYRNKCKSSATSQDQKGPVRFSVGSGSTSPTILMSHRPLSNNGAPRLISEDEVIVLMEENSADLPKSAEKTTVLA